MTLKQLLSKNEREQVDFNLPLPAIAGREISAGQYSVGVQRTPDASETTLGKLANALGKVNPIIAKYSEAQLAATDLQILQTQEKLAGMDLEEKAALLKKSEQSLEKMFRNDYELNPVATYRAKMLIGAEKNVEFAAELSNRIEEFTNQIVRENGDKPSALEIGKEIDQFTQEFIESNENLKQSALMRSGFLQEAYATINDYKVKLPAKIAETHKNDVLIPKATNSLVRLYDLEARDFTDVKALKDNWEANTGSLSVTDQRKIIDDSLALMNYDSSPRNLERSIEFLEDLREAGINIGNQPLDSTDEDGLSESFYSNKVSELEDMRTEVLRKHQLNLAAKALQYQNEKQTEYEKLVAEGVDEDAIYEVTEKNIQNIQSDPDIEPELKPQLIKAVTTAENNAFTGVHLNAVDLTKRTDKDQNADAFKADLGRKMQVIFMGDLKSEKYQGVDVKDAIAVVKTPGGAIGFDKIVYSTVGLGPEAMRISSEAYTEFAEFKRQAIQDIVRVSGGTMRFSGVDKVYEFRDGEDIRAGRARIMNEYLTDLNHQISTEKIQEIRDIVAGKSKARVDAEKEKTAETERRVEALNKKQEAAAALDLADETSVGDAPYGLIGLQKRSGMEALGAQIRSIVTGKLIEPRVNVSDALDKLDKVLSSKPYAPEKTKEIVSNIRKMYEDNQTIYTDRLRHLKDSLITTNSYNPFADPYSTEDDSNYTAVKRQIDKTRDDIIRARRVYGYAPDEIKTILNKAEEGAGYLKEGLRLTDARGFFYRELTGSDPEQDPPAKYSARSLVNFKDDGEIKEVADMLGLDAGMIKESQRKLRAYIEHDELPKPQVKPQPTKEEPKAPKDTQSQLELNLPTEEPIVAPPPPDVPGITELDFSKRITLQTEGSKIKKPMTDLKDTFETIGAKYKIHPAFLMAISTVETGHGSSSAFKNKKNAMGVTINDKVQTFDKVEDSIEMMAKKLSSKTGPYKGLFTIDEIAAKYAPSNASKKNDPNQTNKLWPGLVKKLMKQLGVTDADTIKVLSR